MKGIKLIRIQTCESDTEKMERANRAAVNNLMWNAIRKSFTVDNNKFALQMKSYRNHLNAAIMRISIIICRTFVEWQMAKTILYG